MQRSLVGVEHQSQHMFICDLRGLPGPGGLCVLWKGNVDVEVPILALGSAHNKASPSPKP